MEAQAITMDLTMADGSPLFPAIKNIIEARTKELGETTEQACTAIAINILKSVRADTKIATLKSKIDVEDVSAMYYPSWERAKGSKGKNVSTRVLRVGGKDGNVVDLKKVVWACGHYAKGEKVYTYKVTDHVGHGEDFTYFMVAKSEKDAFSHARKFHEAKVKRTRKLAKYALGLAMHQVHAKQSASDDVTAEARKIGMQNVDVDVRAQGFNSGSVSIYVHDKLDYAALALKSGDMGVQMAAQRALNAMTAYVNKRLDGKGVQDKIDIPFPDVQK